MADSSTPPTQPPAQPPTHGEFFLDERGDDRALRVSWHADASVVVLSFWRHEFCIGTFRLTATDVPLLINLLAAGLDQLPEPGRSSPTPDQSSLPSGPDRSSLASSPSSTPERPALTAGSSPVNGTTLPDVSAYTLSSAAASPSDWAPDALPDTEWRPGSRRRGSD